MTAVDIEPIVPNWTSQDLDHQPTAFATARDVSQLLGQRPIADVEGQLVPLLAASAAELAFGANIDWRFSTDDAPVTLLRLIARVSVKAPLVGGPHTDRLVSQLQEPNVEPSRAQSARPPLA